MSESHDAHLDRVVAGIARYLAEHPEAADSEHGIAEWWLPTLGVDASSEDVRRALAALLRSGRVEAVDIAGQLIWRTRSVAQASDAKL